MAYFRVGGTSLVAFTVAPHEGVVVDVTVAAEVAVVVVAIVVFVSVVSMTTLSASAVCIVFASLPSRNE